MSASRSALKPALVLGLAFGLAGETLLFLHRQCSRVEEILAGDFRVLAFLASDLPEGKARVVEERLRSLPGAEQVEYVAREEALAALRRQDPELARSVALLGENPLHPFFRVRLSRESVARLPAWIEVASGLRELGELRFKPAEAAAIAQLQFYRKLLNLILSLGAAFWLAAAAEGVWGLLRRPRPGSIRGLFLPAAAQGAAASALGMLLVYAAAQPLRSADRLWVWPGAGAHALLLLAGALGLPFFAAEPAAPGKRPPIEDLAADAP